MSAIELSRRGFLRTTGAAGGGLVIGFSLAGCAGSASPISGEAGSLVPNAFLEITPGNIIRFFCPRDEMGQGVTTGLTTLIAEELDVDPRHIQIELAGPHPDYANPAFGLQSTGGSTSMLAHFLQLRQVGADVRRLLLDAAAQDLGVPVSSLSTEDRNVVSNGAPFPYGSFTTTASALPLPEESPLKPASEFKYIGKEFPRLDGMDKATGVSIYGIDVEVPGMHRAVVRRSPVIGGTLASLNKTAAASMPGVTHVVEIDGGVAVVAERYWQAKKAAEKLEIDWAPPELSKVDTARIKSDYQQAMEQDQGDATAEEGDLTAGFEAAAVVVENDYWAPYLAHAPMEPMNAVAHVQGDHADVWCGTQGIGAAQKIVARLANLDIDKVRAHSVYLGGGFGRRATLTHVVEATQISLATGKPIQVLWSREDDLKSGFFRPASLMRIKAGVDQDGRISAWQAKRVGGNVAPGMLKVFLPAALPTMISDGVVDWISGMAEGAMDGWVVDPTSPDEESQACGVDIVGATHGSPAFCPRFVLATKDVVGATSAGARNSGHLRSRFCYFDTLLPLASCRKLDPLRTPRADISVGPFSLGKAVLCLGLRPTSSNPRPSGARYARVHLRSCSDVANLGQNIQPEAAKRTAVQTATLDTGDIFMTINNFHANESVLVQYPG